MKTSEEQDRITKLIWKARMAQFGPDWSLTTVPSLPLQRIRQLCEILADVTNELEKLNRKERG